MATIVTFAGTVRSIWIRFARRDTGAEALAGLGPNLRKEAGLAPENGTWMR
jgi:hypothetical protein